MTNTIIIIDDKKFIGKFSNILSGHPRIIIELKKEEDILFFARWEKSQDYLDISFETISREGVLKKAWCSLDMNEESVTIGWNTDSINWKNI